MRNLKRYPIRPKDVLQAWDSADELLLEHLKQLNLTEEKQARVLIVNDQFGALSCGMNGLDSTTYTDSFVSHQGILQNSGNKINAIHSLTDFSEKYDLVLIRIPKNMSFFEDILCHLSHHLHPNSKVVCGYMVKHQAASSFELLNKYVGETSTSLAKRKARLIFSQFQRGPAESPFPIKIRIDSLLFPNSEFLNHSNLFSREKLDIGTRYFLDHIPKGNFDRILDLGCANGIIGIAAKKINPNSKIIFSDDSQMAIQSAKLNYSSFFSDQAEFKWTNCYENQEPESLDLVLCNPPFHQGNTLGDFIATQMFRDAHSALIKGGKIRIIGNSHLRYDLALSKIFRSSVIKIGSNEKFTILEVSKL